MIFLVSWIMKFWESKLKTKQMLTSFLSYVCLTLCIIRRKKWTGVVISFSYVYSRKDHVSKHWEKVLAFFNWGEDKEPTTGWQRPRACSDPVWNLAMRGTVWSQWEGPLWNVSLSLSDLQCPRTRLQGSTAALCSWQNNGKDGNHGKQRIAQPPGLL